MIIEAAGAVSLAAWIYLLVARGGFWRMHRGAVGQASWPVNQPPAVAAVIPARNEAPVVGRAVASLAAQQYAGRFYILLVDDASDDGTADTARAAAPAEMLTVVRGSPLPQIYQP